MSYKRATLTDERNPNLKLRIAVGDEGDVFVKVMVGKASSEIVHLKKGQTTEQILDYFAEIVEMKNADVPIGSEVEHNGEKFVVTKASDGCIGCVFEKVGLKCPDVYCNGDDRADGTDIVFKRKR